MGKVVYFEEATTDWLEVPDSWEGKVDEGEPDVRYKILTQPAPGIPGVQFVEFEAGHHEHAHSHPESEVLYVLAGEMTVGDLKMGAGSGAFIQKGTTYGPLDTSDGVRFLRVGLGD